MAVRDCRPEMVQPDVADNVRVCEETADGERPVYLILLAFGETQFGLEGFELWFHPLSAFPHTYAIHKYDRKIHG